MPDALDFGQAETQFKKILALDPYRIDDIDVYSNILYVTENRLELSKLAHDFLGLDKDRPEVCCLVGKLLRYARHTDLSLIAFSQVTTTPSVPSMIRQSSTSSAPLNWTEHTCPRGR